ncbi:MAG TPA: LamG-like jellyroll fold domain-containing protein [Flavipsychrobacter sp.]|nr:LamG-like jellyroll fold domain-containing protein [Flavipsychrobacter sp.]
MKKLLLTNLLVLIVCSLFAQDTTGLIAHWKFNGDVLDATGKGHDGTAYNLTSVAGESGAPHTGYYFNGANSYIIVPYQSDLNVSTFSICSVVKVLGFYQGDCQINAILFRGTTYAPGFYCFDFSDDTYDSSCSTIDTTKDGFESGVGLNPSLTYASLHYSPNIVENKWYRVVTTFDGTYISVYVNGELKAKSLTSASPTETSTEGISIGKNDFGDSVDFPYWFNGILDDLELYNRVLSDSEIIRYDSTIATSVPGTISQQQSVQIYPNPVKNMLNVKMTYQLNGHTSAEIVNQLGQVVKKSEIVSQQQQIPVGDLPSGVYFIHIQDNAGTITEKFVKE